MSLLPVFELGFWNAWIFMIWPIISPLISSIIITEKSVSKKLRISAPMKYEKLFNVISMAAILFGFIYSIFLPLQLNMVWFYLGLLLFFFGMLIDFSVFVFLGKADSDKPFTKGPYKYSRHPLYIALFLIILSVSIMSLSWVFLIIVAILIIHFILVAHAEEKYCLNKYGEEYQKYLNKTPRWIGFPKSEKNT